MSTERSLHREDTKLTRPDTEAAKVATLSDVQYEAELAYAADPDGFTRAYEAAYVPRLGSNEGRFGTNR